MARGMTDGTITGGQWLIKGAAVIRSCCTRSIITTSLLRSSVSRS